ncbi:MAG: alpha/beta hydrolase [Bryobacteraceae bacterium]
MIRVAFVVIMLSSAIPVFAQGRGQGMDYTPPPAPTDVVPGSITNEDVPYPYPVHYLPLTLYGQDVRMAFMDVPPAGQPNGRTVLLFHGMNFGGFYFAGPIEALRKEGFRVVVTDQIGFGRSSKPIIPYNFNDMASNSRKVLESLGITNAAVVGHSMGGMLATRFAALYPDITERVVIYNPIGLTDTRYNGRRQPSVDEMYKATMAQTHDQAYQAAYAVIRHYFASDWKESYASFARIMYAPTLSADAPRLAMVRTLLGQMVGSDPVVYDWPHIKVKALVLGGDKDGPDFPAQAKHIADSIPGAQLVLIPGAGHVPHIQVPEIFNRELLKFLKSDSGTSSATSAAR